MPTAPPVHRSAGWTERKPWRKGAGTVERKLTGRPWRRLRDRVMERDKWLCQHCLDMGLVTLATECDHIIPIAAGGSDQETNLQGLCHRCHGVKTAKEGEGSASANPGWLPSPACAVVLVTGPPGGGKTTYCKQTAKHGDVVIDLDECFKDVCGVHGHEASASHLDDALRWRNRQIADLASKNKGTAYVIVSAPTTAERQWWVNKLGSSHVACDPGEKVCLDRITGRRQEAARRWYRVAEIDVWDRSRGGTIGRGVG